MSPSAQCAQLDFVRLVAEEPSSLYFEQFLRDGYDAWPAAYQRRFSGLSTWQGVSRLKQSLRRLANAPQEGKMLLASRSLSLVRLAAQHLFRVCKHVLATDLSWPTYQRAIERQATRTSLQITTVSLRDEILRHGWTADDVVSALAEAAVAHGCDGLFLPAVDHLGIRLPIRPIVEEIRRRCKLNFVFVDAAQAFCHITLDDCLAVADFVVAGSHKWMGAYLPTGIGFVRHQQLQRGGRQSDPLLHFTEQLASGALDRHSETANLTNLFACAGAVRDQHVRPTRSLASVAGAPLSGLSLPQSLREWRPLRPCPAMQSHILLLETTDSPTRQASADVVRRSWLREGLIVTGYDGGCARVSRPISLSECHDAFTAGGISAGA